MKLVSSKSRYIIHIVFLLFIIVFSLGYTIKQGFQTIFREGLLSQPEVVNINKVLDTAPKIMDEICVDTIDKIKEVLRDMKKSENDEKLKIYEVLNKYDVDSKKNTACDSVNEISRMESDSILTNKKIIKILDEDNAARINATSKILLKVRDLKIDSDAALSGIIDKQISNPSYKGKQPSIETIQRHITDMDDIMKKGSKQIDDETMDKIKKAKSAVAV